MKIRTEISLSNQITLMSIEIEINLNRKSKKKRQMCLSVNLLFIKYNS